MQLPENKSAAWD